MQTTEFLNSLFATRNAHHAANSADAADAAYAPPSPHPHTRARPQPSGRRVPQAEGEQFAMSSNGIRDKVAIVGIGETAVCRKPGSGLPLHTSDRARYRA